MSGVWAHPILSGCPHRPEKTKVSKSLSCLRNIMLLRGLYGSGLRLSPINSLVIRPPAFWSAYASTADGEERNGGSKASGAIIPEWVGDIIGIRIPIWPRANLGAQRRSREELQKLNLREIVFIGFFHGLVTPDGNPIPDFPCTAHQGSDGASGSPLERFDIALEFLLPACRAPSPISSKDGNGLKAPAVKEREFWPSVRPFT